MTTLTSGSSLAVTSDSSLAPTWTEASENYGSTLRLQATKGLTTMPPSYSHS
jgi:hypothetical protein